MNEFAMTALEVAGPVLLVGVVAFGFVGWRSNRDEKRQARNEIADIVNRTTVRPIYIPGYSNPAHRPKISDRFIGTNPTDPV